MSFVIAAPEFVAAAVTDLSNIGSAVSAANPAAPSSTPVALNPVVSQKVLRGIGGSNDDTNERLPFDRACSPAVEYRLRPMGRRARKGV
jgi:PE family